MDVAAGITDVFIHVGEKSNHLMPHLGFNFEDAFDFEMGLCFDRVQSILRNPSELAVCLGGRNFYIKPALELGLLTPDGPISGRV